MYRTLNKEHFPERLLVPGIVFFVAIILPLIFFVTKGDTSTAELAFAEESYGNIGSVIPASCESDPMVANGDGFFDGCFSEVCWDGTVSIPAAGQTCPPPPPVVSFSADTYNLLYGQSTNLNWSATGAVSCSGNFSMSGAVSGTAGTGALTGDTTFTVTCYNSAGVGTTQSLTIDIDMIPTANAGIDRSIILPTTRVSPAGVLATDPEGGGVTIVWSNILAPIGAPAVTILNNGTLSPEFRNLVTKGTYVFQIQVTDSAGQVSTDTMLVVVYNDFPLVNAGIDRSIYLSDGASSASGASAYDPEGFPLTILWESTGVPSGATTPGISDTTALNPSFTGLTTPGVYTFRITVTDNIGQIAQDTMTVTVVDDTCATPPPCAPVPPLPPEDPVPPPVGPGGGGGSGSGQSPRGNLYVNGLSTDQINAGETAILTWSTDNTTSCTVQDGLGNILSDGPTDNTVGISVSPAVTTIYYLICDGTNGSNDVPIDAISLQVGAEGVSAPTLTANARTVVSGGAVVLEWDLNGQASCTLTGGGLNQVVTAFPNTLSVQVSARTTYTVTCPIGSASFTVEVLPQGFET